MRIALVLGTWAALLWGVWTALRPNLGDKGGFTGIGEPNWFLAAVFGVLLAFFLAPQLSSRIKPGPTVLAVLLLLPSMFYLKVAASFVHEQLVAQHVPATVIAVHNRISDDSGKPLTFRFPDGTQQRGFSAGDPGWRKGTASYPDVGDQVLVARDPWGVLPPHEIIGGEAESRAAPGLTYAAAVLGVLDLLALGAFSISVLTRRDSGLNAAERGEWGEEDEKEKDPLDPGRCASVSAPPLWKSTKERSVASRC